MTQETKRLKLHEELCELLGSRYCYFCPPTGLTMKYPCIRYERSSAPREVYADNRIYLFKQNYTLTVIDYDPDTEIPEKLKERFLYCRQERQYKAEGLNHFILSLFY